MSANRFIVPTLLFQLDDTGYNSSYYMGILQNFMKGTPPARRRFQIGCGADSRSGAAQIRGFPRFCARFRGFGRPSRHFRARFRAFALASRHFQARSRAFALSSRHFQPRSRAFALSSQSFSGSVLSIHPCIPAFLRDFDGTPLTETGGFQHFRPFLTGYSS